LFSIETRSAARVHTRWTNRLPGIIRWDNWPPVSHILFDIPLNNWTWNLLTEKKKRARAVYNEAVYQSCNTRAISCKEFFFDTFTAARSVCFVHETQHIYKIDLRKSASLIFLTIKYDWIYTTARREKQCILWKIIFPRSQEAGTWERKWHWGGL